MLSPTEDEKDEDAPKTKPAAYRAECHHLQKRVFDPCARCGSRKLFSRHFFEQMLGENWLEMLRADKGSEHYRTLSRQQSRTRRT